MEVGLWFYDDILLISIGDGLNPCFGGSWVMIRLHSNFTQAITES